MVRLSDKLTKSQGNEKMAKLAVYCGAASGFSPLFEQATKQLGKWMVENNLELIYGGGKYGLMGTLAQTCQRLRWQSSRHCPRSLVQPSNHL